MSYTRVCWWQHEECLALPDAPPRLGILVCASWTKVKWMRGYPSRFTQGKQLKHAAKLPHDWSSAFTAEIAKLPCMVLVSCPCFDVGQLTRLLLRLLHGIT
jgi:hypothetical protein